MQTEDIQVSRKDLHVQLNPERGEGVNSNGQPDHKFPTFMDAFPKVNVHYQVKVLIDMCTYILPTLCELHF